MSYILEALRKSDQQRQRGAAPISLATPVAAPPPRPARVYRNGLLALFLLALGVGVGWLRPWQAAAPAAPAVSEPAPTGPARLAPPRQIEYMVPAPVASLPPPATPAPARVEVPETAAARPLENPPVVTAEPVAAAPASEPPPKILTLNELPQAVRQTLPAIAIAMHAYANAPGDRIVMINNQLLRQGEQVAPGLRLEQITQEGVVLAYQGYRFRHGVRQ